MLARAIDAEDASERMLSRDAWKSGMSRGIAPDANLRFLVEELKPLVDFAYRTRPERARTASWGRAWVG